MASIDAVGDKLGIMQAGSEARRLWTRVKDDLSRYLATGDTGANRHRICTTLESMDACLRAEFSRIGVLPPLTHVLGYVQNIGAIIALILEHGDIPRENAETYVMTTSRLLPFSFSDEFMGVHKSVLELVRRSFTVGLGEGELDKIYEQIVWMADNLLTHFQPEAHEAENMAVALVALSRELEIDHLAFATSITGHQSTENWVPAQMSSRVSTRDNESDGEEKADVSEKNEKEKDVFDSEDQQIPPKCDEAVSLLSDYERSDETERVTQRLLSSVLSSDNWSKDSNIQKQLAEMMRGNHMHLLEMEMESLSRNLRKTAEEIEKEIGHLKACCLETVSDVVRKALSTALSEKNCSLEEVTNQTTRLKAFRSHCWMSTSRVRQKLSDLSKEEILLALSRALESYKTNATVLRQLAKEASPLLW